MRNVFGWNTDTAIIDANDNMFCVTADVDRHISLRRVLDSIFDQVRDDFSEVVVIEIGVEYWREPAV
ncbi:hypothetical protein D3C86_1583220 [compost metagenome]